MQTYAAVMSHPSVSLIAPASRKRSTIWRSFVRSGMCLLEITLGLHAGAVAGGITGWAAGVSFRAVFEPASLFGLEKIKSWYFMPDTFAFYGFYVGAILGVLIIHRYSQNLLKDRIHDLYEKGQEKPEQLARLLYQNEKKIRWMLSRMIEKGELVPHQAK